MRKGTNLHIVNDALRGIRLSRQPTLGQVTRAIDRVLTYKPQIGGRKQGLLEMEIRDELSRRAGNRIRWRF